MKKEKSKEIKHYVLSSLSLLGFSLLFSALSLILMLDAIPDWVRILGSIVFIVPTIFIAFTHGKSQGEKMYKQYAKTDLSDIHAERVIKLPYHKCVFHVIGFVGFMFIMLILSVAIGNGILQFITLLFEFPPVLIFSSIGVLNLSARAPLILAIFIPYTLIIAGAFVGGYLLKAYSLKRQHGTLENELRSYDN